MEARKDFGVREVILFVIGIAFFGAFFTGFVITVDSFGDESTYPIVFVLFYLISSVFMSAVFLTWFFDV